MVVNGLSQFCGKSYTGLSCKKLGGDADCESGSCHEYQNKKSLDDIRAIISSDTYINDLGNDYRDKQIKHNFQKFEERGKNAFFPVIFQIDCERSHF